MANTASNDIPEVTEKSLYKIIQENLYPDIFKKTECDGVIIKIENTQPFIWNEWDILGDIELMPYDFSIHFKKITFHVIKGGDPNKEVKTITKKSFVICESTFKEELIFSGCEFQNSLEIISCNLQKDFILRGVRFLGKANFSRSTFSGILFENSTFQERCLFVNTDFQHSINGRTRFSENIFNKEISFGESTFKNHTNFSSNTFNGPVRMFSTIFESNVYFQKCIIRQETLFDFRNATVEKTLSFNLENPSKYRYITLALHNANIAYFSSDHEELMNIRLKSEDYKNIYAPSNLYLVKKNHYTREMSDIYLHELRLLQSIFKTLNIHKGDDGYYKKIMNEKTRQLLMDKKLFSLIKYIIRTCIFRGIFGWGVTFARPFIASLCIIGGFAPLFYMTLSTNNIGTANFEAITNVIGNGNFSPWQISGILSFQSFFSLIVPEKDITKLGTALGYLSTAEAIIGTLFITTLVAILSRKFMRM